MSPPSTPDRDEINVNAVVSYNLRAIRQRRGLTQDQVAERLAVLTGHLLTQASISAMERGPDGQRRRRFDAHDLYMLSAVFEVPITYFFIPPPAMNGAELAHTHRPLHDLVVALLGRERQLPDMHDRVAELDDPQKAAGITAGLAGSNDALPPTGRDHYRAWRDRRLAEITRTCDGLDNAVQVLGAFLDQLRQLGIRNFLTGTEGTPPMASADPHDHFVAFDPTPPPRPPLD